MIRHPALAVFKSLPLSERLFVRARLFSAPLHELASRARGPRILDVGCGHGLLCAMMALGFADREVVGIDIDPLKIDLARRSVGRLGNTRFDVMTIGRLASLEPGTFDTITVADVLYLISPEHWPEVLNASHALLKRGGQLLRKEAEADGSWKSTKALWQERAMVKVLGKTKSDGGLGFFPRATMQAALEKAGFRVTSTISLSRWSSTPHLLFVAECV